ncbi:MAG: hypothetical protein AAGA48_08680 [Myxococcota bacterium]
MIPLERLMNQPDAASWQVMGDALLDQLPAASPSVLDALEAWSAGLAEQFRAPWRDMGLPSLALVPFEGQVAVVQRTGPDAGFVRKTVEPTEVSVSANWSSTMATEAGVSPFLDAISAVLGLPNVEFHWNGGLLGAIRWFEVVETVSDPMVEIRLSDAQAEDSEFMVGDQFGRPKPFEAAIAVWALLLCLRQGRPISIRPPPSGVSEVEAMMERETALTALEPAVLWAFIDLALVIQVPGRGRFPVVRQGREVRAVLALRAVEGQPANGEVHVQDVGVSEGTWVRFDRGQVPLEDVIAGLDRAFQDWRHHREYTGWLANPELPDDAVFTNVGALFPLREDVVFAVIDAMREHRPLLTPPTPTARVRRFDDHEAYLQLAALNQAELERVVRSLLAHIADAMRSTDPDSAKTLQRMLGNDDRLLAELTEVPEPVARANESHSDVMTLALVLADGVAQRQGAPLPSRVWTPDRPGIDQVASQVAALTCEERAFLFKP